METEDQRLVYFSTVAESLRESGEYSLLAALYDSYGNAELRDKYVEMALEGDPSDALIVYLRGLQDRPDLIPKEVSVRRLRIQAEHEDWTQRARTLVTLGRKVEAAENYVKGVLESLHSDNTFSAAYYLKELAEQGIVEALFEARLEKAAAEHDLWWQHRCFEELGWRTERKQFLLDNAEEIENSTSFLLPELRQAQGRTVEAAQIRAELSSAARVVSVGDTAVDAPSDPTELD